MISAREILILREAFYSCKLSGFVQGMTFDEYLEKEIERRNTKNKFKISGTDKYMSRKTLASKLEGDNRYVGDYYIPQVRSVCTCFHNSNPNLEKGHKEYPFLFYDNQGQLVISAFDKDGWRSVEKYKI